MVSPLPVHVGTVLASSEPVCTDNSYAAYWLSRDTFFQLHCERSPSAKARLLLNNSRFKFICIFIYKNCLPPCRRFDTRKYRIELDIQFFRCRRYSARLLDPVQELWTVTSAKILRSNESALEFLDLSNACTEDDRSEQKRKLL